MKVLKRLLSYLKIVKFPFIAGITLLLLSAGMTQSAPLIVQNIIDTILTPVMQQEQQLDQGKMILGVAAYLGVSIVGNLIGYFSVILLMKCANKIAAHLRNLAFDTLQHLPISYFSDKPAGKISSRIINDTETLRSQFYGSLLSNILVTSVSIIAIYIILFMLNVWLAAGLLLLIPLFIIWQWGWTKIIKRPLEQYYELRSDVTTQVNEMMSGSEIIQLYQQETAMIETFETVVDKMYESEKRMNFAHATLSWSLVEALKRIVILGILAYIGFFMIGGKLGLSAGIILSYINYIDRIFNNMGGLVRIIPELQRSFVTGQRVIELIDEPRESDSTDMFEMTHGEVVFENVSFGYQPPHMILKSINFSVKPGQTVALVGHTGSGKSSLINLLFRFYDPQKGQILIDGQNIQQFNRESVRKEMGIVLQEPYLFTGTIASNVTMENTMISDKEVELALQQVGAKDMLDKLPEGIHTPVVEKGNTFSSGERQLISFARTLANNPKILILDEATSHIDTETETMIQTAMQVVKEGRTTFIIAHRLSTIRDADLILVLNEGEIVERGTHEALLELNGLYAQMYEIQLKQQENK